jgi:hypothetical protein
VQNLTFIFVGSQEASGQLKECPFSYKILNNLGLKLAFFVFKRRFFQGSLNMISGTRKNQNLSDRVIRLARGGAKIGIIQVPSTLTRSNFLKISFLIQVVYEKLFKISIYTWPLRYS